jgi:hypothetical protein
MKTVVGQFKLEESPKEDSEEVTKKLMKIKLRLPPITLQQEEEKEEDPIQYCIIDIPGLEDFFWQQRIVKYI